MATSAKENLLRAILLGAMLAASAPVAADQREVVNEIRVQPATRTITRHSDATLAKEVRDSLRSHWTTSPVAIRIRVGVQDGVATLAGDLDTWAERLEAGRVAFGTEGVWKVQNRLTVKGYGYEWEKWEYEALDYYEELFPNVG